MGEVPPTAEPGAAPGPEGGRFLGAVLRLRVRGFLLRVLSGSESELEREERMGQPGPSQGTTAASGRPTGLGDTDEVTALQV